MSGRVVPDGKAFALDGVPWRLRGVTYGSFVPRLDGEPFPERTQVKKDFLRMADCGLNTVRTYELPPPDVFDVAEEYGLRMLVGLHHHDWRMEPRPSRDASRRIRASGRQAVAEAVARCNGRDNIVGIAVGNEIPGDIVRVHGIAAVEDTLSSLIALIHDESDLSATYVNFPTTEFLEPAGQDFVSFNVFLEDPDDLRRYLRHLQVVALDRPLIITELGLPSLVHGEDTQASSLASQLRVVDETGCAGATVFSWTDDWGVAGVQVDGWGFGVTDLERRPKPALEVVEAWARRPIVALREEWPKVSVIVCAFNEERTIEECLASLTGCPYPHLEVILCDDGSTDRTLEIARGFPFRILELPHGGLSRARNAGLAAATGDIVAYLDADAWCHPDWPFHLVMSFDDEQVAATGGPNLPVDGAGFVERAVARSPGGPLEVLITDDRAEHVPGCNMAFRKHELAAIGGFNPEYTSAGDDVDVCWKLLDRGREIAFAHAAQVRHHRRSTVMGYLRQQRGYGKAEKMLAGPHRHRFNRMGQARWAGVIYGGAGILPSLLRPVVYHGHQGAAPFQRVVRRRSEWMNMWASASLPAVLPIALVGLVAGVTVSTTWYTLVALAMAATLGYGALVAVASCPDRSEPLPLRMRLTIGALHVLQPFWRTYGRVRGTRVTQPAGESGGGWFGDRWLLLASMEKELRGRGCAVRYGRPHDDWDVQVSLGPFVNARVTTAVAWSWVPQVVVQYRPGLGTAAAAGLVLLGVMVSAAVGWGALGLAVLVIQVDRWALGKRLGEGLLRAGVDGSSLDDSPLGPERVEVDG